MLGAPTYADVARSVRENEGVTSVADGAAPWAIGGRSSHLWSERGRESGEVSNRTERTGRRAPAHRGAHRPFLATSRARLAGYTLFALLAIGLAGNAAATARRSGRVTALVSQARCLPHGHVDLRTPAVVLWSTRGGAQLFACVPATGSVHLLASAGPYSSFEDFLAAGHFVSLVYADGAFFYLDVFDALTGRAVLMRNIGCSGPDGCEGAGASFQLASDGWVALVGQSLRATDGREETIELDSGPNLEATHQKGWGSDGVSIQQGTGQRLQWSPSDDTSLYSFALGSSLRALGMKALEAGTVHAADPLPTACSLFTASEVQAVLGQVSQASPNDACTYTTTAKPASTLTLTLRPGLTRTQVTAIEHQAFGELSSSAQGGDVGPPDYNPHLWKAAWDTAGEDMSESNDVRIFAGIELNVDLVTADPSNHADDRIGPSKIWDSDDAAEHAADIAFDRLAGISISYEHR